MQSRGGVFLHSIGSVFRQSRGSVFIQSRGSVLYTRGSVDSREVVSYTVER